MTLHMPLYGNNGIRYGPYIVAHKNETEEVEQAGEEVIVLQQILSLNSLFLVTTNVRYEIPSSFTILDKHGLVVRSLKTRRRVSHILYTYSTTHHTFNATRIGLHPIAREVFVLDDGLVSVPSSPLYAHPLFCHLFR